MSWPHRNVAHVRAKVAELATDSLEVIAEMVLGLEDNLEAMTAERDELRAKLDEATS